MKTAKNNLLHGLLGLSVIALAGAVPATARADFFHGPTTGDDLVRRNITVGANQTLTIQTMGCDSGEDTVIFLLDGTTNQSGNRITQAFNDDDGFSGTYCSYVFFRNTTTTSKTYTLLVSSYDAGQVADVSLLLQIGTAPRTTEAVRAGGFATRFNGNATGEFVETIPVGSFRGGQPHDSVLYVIDPGTGRTSKFNDDAGINTLSRISANLDCTNTECWLVAGHYGTGNGSAMMAWSQRTSGNDTDSDGISNTIEDQLTSAGVLSTNAIFNKDPDNDGITDYQELVGVKAGNLDGDESSLVPGWIDDGADPKVQDLFIEIDWMDDGLGNNHRPGNALATDMNAVFRNDTTFTGRNIRVHVDYSQNVGYWQRISLTCPTSTAAQSKNFYEIKNDPDFFDPLRIKVFHYAIAGLGQREKDSNGVCTNTGSTGIGEILGNDFIVTTAANSSPDVVRGTHDHELGHNLYLTHNGNDDATGAFSCVHSSVMNFRYQLGGYPGSGNTLRGFGYSTGGCTARVNAGCSNTCTARCVPAGQVSPKASCPIAASGPNKGKRVSNGSCDCDLTEWTNPGNNAIANQVSLKFQDVAFGSSGASVSSEEEDISDYLHGGIAKRNGMQSAISRVAARKRARLQSDGLIEGRDFSIDPENGKAYSTSK